MKAIPYSVTLLENVLVGDPAMEDPNTTGGLNYIPGGVMRGVVIEWLKSKDLDNLDLSTFSLCMNGTVKFLNAYPGTDDQKRTRPAPLYLRKTKDDESQVFNIAVRTEDTIKGQLKSFPCPFMWQDGTLGAAATSYGFEPDWQIRLHNVRSEGNGPNGQDAQLFTYKSLTAGQVFRGYLLSEDMESLSRMKKELPSGEWETDIGKSKSAEYGRVRICFDDFEDNWQEIAGNGQPHADGKLVVTLLSDVIIRDSKSGSFASDLTPALEVPHERAFAGQKIIGGYNRYWKLPLPQCRVISAGSAFNYQSSPELLEKIQSLVESGVGERTIDGFGRITLDVMEAERYDYRDGKSEKIEVSAFGQKGASATGSVKDVAERILLQRARRELPRVAGDTPTRNLPPNTQLSRLERVLRKEKMALSASTEGQSAEGFVYINPFLESLTRDTKLKYNDAFVNHQPMLKWLQKELGNPDSIWERLQVKNPEIAGANLQRNSLSKLIIVEYISMVLKLERKKRKTKNGKQEGNHGQ